VGQGNNSLNTYYFVFNHLQAYCKDRGISWNFMEGFKSFKKTKAKIDIFSQSEINSLLTTHLPYKRLDCRFLDEMYITFTMFLAYTGCRFSEVRNLKVQDLDFGNGKAKIKGAKTYEIRTVYITEPLLGRLRKQIEGKEFKDYVFNNAAGKPLNPQDYDRDLKLRAKKAGVIKRVFPHNFRHTYITNLLEEGVPITEVATLVGHKDIQTTYSTYMHLADKTLERAAKRHPALRLNVPPDEIIRSLKELIENQHFEKDFRFNYQLSQDQKSLSIKLQIKK